MSKQKIISLVTLLFSVASFSAFAEHSWNNYHWARSISPFQLQVVDSVTADWDQELKVTLTDWSGSGVIDLAVTSSNDSNRARKRCKTVDGQYDEAGVEFHNVIF